MPSTKSIRFQYYVPFIDEESNPTHRMNFMRWVEKIDDLPKEKRFKDVFHVKTRLEMMQFFDKDNIWAMRFLKMRDFNIPLIAKAQGNAKEIGLAADEFVAEGLHVIYDSNYNLLMVQVNKNSLSLAALEDYINQVWDNKKDKISLRPILRDIDLKNFRKKGYKKLKINFANMTPGRTTQTDGSFLGGILDSFHKINCYSAEVSYSLGHKKMRRLHLKQCRKQFLMWLRIVTLLPRQPYHV